MGQVIEGQRELPVLGKYDVVVAGGGIAGVAAAVAAARNGASVCLLEKAFGLGGLATLGNVIVYLPICDGMGRQVMGGLAEELLHLSVADLKQDDLAARFNRVPHCWQPGGDLEERKKTRFRVDFNPASYQLVLEKLLLDEGVKILYDTRVCAVDSDVQMIRHLLIENKSGRSAIACGMIIDA
ncbi:MAG: FAD-dependent oxidoreductase, partial [Candidatus Latescibacteria bacterium]|nr:FAD-dependent oxidoreductase [Candidatus Latescibacterota bacterium]